MIRHLIPYTVLLLLTFAITGCANLYSRAGLRQSENRFNLGEVWYQCARLGCWEPNAVVTAYFADIAARAGAACIAHIFLPGSGDAVWYFWDDYIAPLQPLLSHHRIRFYAYTPDSGRDTAQHYQARAHLDEVRHLYLYHGALRQNTSLHVTHREDTVLPPYRASFCQGRPVLELTTGARLVSGFASAAAEHVSPERAVRTVLVVLD